MALPGTKLDRPPIAWPKASSVWTYPVANTIITTLTNGHFVAHMGWYMDDRRSGPVWHRWPKHWLTSYGISAISAIYGLWCQGQLDVLIGTSTSHEELWLISSGSMDHLADEAPLEYAVAIQLSRGTAVSIRAVVDGLPWPDLHRTIGDFLFGVDRVRTATEATCFAPRTADRTLSPAEMLKGIDVVRAFVQLESCSDIYAKSPPDEAEAERRDQAQLEIEEAVLSAVVRLL